MATGFFLNKGSIYALYTKQKNGKRLRLEYYPGYIIEDPEKEWNGKIHRPRGEKYKEINEELDKIKPYINDIVGEIDPFTLTNESFSELINKKRFNQESKKQTSFFQYAETFISEAKKEKGHEYANSFRTILNKLMEYDPQLTFERIDKPFYRNFKIWLEKQGYSKNYVGSMIRDLKRILNRATDDDINTNTVFENFSVDAEDVFNIYLSEKEIEKIYNLQITDSDIVMLQQEGEEEEVFLSKSNIYRQKTALDRARKLFVIGCWTGLRVENYLSIDPDIQVDLKNKVLHAIANKNGPKLEIPLHKLVRKIIMEDGFPKPISQQKLNKQIKVLGKLAGITEPIMYSKTIGGKRKTFSKPKYEMITTHTARRSFASNLTLAGVPKQYTMAVTGHRTERSFNKYIQAVLKDQLTAKLKDYDVWG